MKKAAKKAKSRKPARAPRAKPGRTDHSRLFEQALGFTSTGYLFDAIATFRKCAETDPKSELADDAYYNAGLCYYDLKFFHEAVSYFTRVIQGYPRAKINAVPGAKEFGRTAAKAHLGRLRAYLALGRRDDAQKELDELNRYPDSYVLDGDGKKHTFYELGLAALK